MSRCRRYRSGALSDSGLSRVMVGQNLPHGALRSYPSITIHEVRAEIEKKNSSLLHREEVFASRSGKGHGRAEFTDPLRSIAYMKDPN